MFFALFSIWKLEAIEFVILATHYIFFLSLNYDGLPVCSTMMALSRCIEPATYRVDD